MDRHGVRVSGFRTESDSPTDGPTDSPTRGAAALGRAVGEANAGAIVAALGGRRDATVTEIARASGVSDRRVRDHLYRLAAAGLVERTGATRWRLTPAGGAQAGPPASRADLARVLDLLPSEAHRALARLVLAAVVARWHRGVDGATGWPSFGLWEPPGSGKTTVGRLCARVLGLDEYAVVRVASDLDRAELLGRRVPDGTGAYRFAPALALGRPLLCLDELDKVRGEARADALRLLQGDSALVLEGERVRLAASVLVTFNAGADPRDVLPADRLRRMVHVSTVGVHEAECRRAAGQLFDEASLPVLDLDRIDVPAGPGAEVRRYFDEELVRSLVAEARALYPGHALSLIVPGRMALGGTDEEEAARAVAADYLVCAATWGGARTTALARFAEPGGAPTVADDEDDTPAGAIGLAEVRAVLCETAKADRRALARAKDTEAIALRGALAELVAQLKAATTAAEVEDLGRILAGLQHRARRHEEAEVARGLAAGRRTRSHPAAPASRAAYLAELARIGSREPPGPVLARLGLAEDDPLPTGHGRWRGNGRSTRGAVVHEGDTWHEPAVQMILAEAIAAEPEPDGRPTLALVPGGLA